MNIALINTNRMKPPIAPIGMEYVAESLIAAGFPVDILDLCWEDDFTTAISDFFSQKEYALVGLSLRNTDDCAFSKRQSFLGDFYAMVSIVRGLTDALLVVGGVGFSSMPELILDNCDADAGVWGDGEFAFVELTKRIRKHTAWKDVPGAICKQNGAWQRNASGESSLDQLPQMKRNIVDNARYFQEGGQIGFETKRGCDCRCIYCADPVAKGSSIRCRPPVAVVDELESLLAQGVDHFHTCDAEFNLPEEHAKEVCREIINRGMGDTLKWYAYCTPKSFSRELAPLMAQAGCVGINYGVDNGDPRMLQNLKRGFTPDDIAAVARRCRDAGIVTMFDLLLGAPGETKESIANTITLMKQTKPDRVGVTVGVRVYPRTELANRVESGEITDGLVYGDNEQEPLFFVDPSVKNIISEYLDEMIGDDPRFLFFNPDNPKKNYNYNANDVLVEAIKQGHRGAYWDILRRIG